MNHSLCAYFFFFFFFSNSAVLLQPGHCFSKFNSVISYAFSAARFVVMFLGYDLTVFIFLRGQFVMVFRILS